MPTSPRVSVRSAVVQFIRELERRGRKEFVHLAIDRGATAPEPGELLA